MSKKTENYLKFWAIGYAIIQLVFAAGMFYATQKQIIPKLEIISALAHRNELDIAVIKAENEALRERIDYLHRDRRRASR